jgi:DNA-binding response OmpR family regulator
MSRTILIVDDERDLAVACERLLRRGGWRVVTAGTRDAGLTALAAQPRPALAIVDRQLPDGDGLDILRASRETYIPVILMTGHASSAIRETVLDAGAAGFLAKPFSARALFDLVHAILGDGPIPVAPPVPLPPPAPVPAAECELLTRPARTLAEVWMAHVR